MAGTYQGGSLVFGAPIVHTIVMPDEIGAVEIRDSATDARAAVVNVLGVERLAVDATVAGGVFPLPLPVQIAGPLPVPVIAPVQVPLADTISPLGASGTFNGVSRDCLNYPGYGVSLFITRNLVDTDVDMIVEESFDGLTWREVETVNIAVTAAIPSAGAQRVYSPCRRYMQTRLVNKTANALAVTELYIMLKPIP